VTTQDESENSFAPLSDTDLASILEAQLAQMRGTRVAPRVDAPAGNLLAVDASTGDASTSAAPSWTDELFDAPTQEMTATEVAAVREPKQTEQTGQTEQAVYVAPVFVEVVETVPAVIAESAVFAAPDVGIAVSVAVAASFAEPMMFSASEMQRLRGQASSVVQSENGLPALPVVPQTSNIEQQLMQVFAEIEAFELAKSQRALEPESASVTEVVEVAEVADVTGSAENTPHSVQNQVVPEVKLGSAASLSFDDILFGTSPDE
jgi:hypothetical protein